MKTIREQLEPLPPVDLNMLPLSVLIAASQAISLKRIADALEETAAYKREDRRGS